MRSKEHWQDGNGESQGWISGRTTTINGQAVQHVTHIDTSEAMDWQPTINRRRARWVLKEELPQRRGKGLCLRCGSAQLAIKLRNAPYQPPQDTVDLRTNRIPRRKSMQLLLLMLV